MNDTTTRCQALPWNATNAERLLQTQPGDAEAAAAIKGMQETYGSPSLGTTKLVGTQYVTTWAVGDWAAVRCPDGVVRQGHVIEMLTDAGADSEYHVACHVPGRGRQHYAIKAKDFTIF
jgi:translation initiation factor IF-1